MEITQEQAEGKLNSQNNLLNKLKITPAPIFSPKKLDGTNFYAGQQRKVPIKLATTAAILARMGESASAIENNLGIPASSTKHYKYGDVNLPEEKIDGRLKQIEDTVLEKIILSLGIISPEKLAKTSARDASMIASNLRHFLKPPADENERNNKNTQVIVFAPNIKTEDKYNVIEV